jgi:RNA polymerase sigma-70 factor (ECF subfamily)
MHQRAQADRWGLSVDAFRTALEASIGHAFAEGAVANADIEAYLSSLHLTDLALACACAAGIESAWDHFIREHRPGLYRAADAIDRTGGARELADAIYADLFGLAERDGQRQSLFRYFHGRSSLGVWVRAVLSQRHVDRLRAARRLDPLSDDEATTLRAPRDTRAGTDGFGTVMQSALVAALGALAPRDRLRLACYYAQNMKLAAIGRMLGEHEATVSRHLTRTRADVRAAVEQWLKQHRGYDAAAIAECFSAVADDSGAMDLGTMLAAAEAGKKSVVDRS